MKRAALLFAVLVVGLATTGCFTPQALGQLAGLKPDGMLTAAPVVEGVVQARRAAWAMAATLFVIQCLVSAWHVYFGGEGEGRRWSSGFILWAVAAVFAVSTMGAEQWYSPDRALREMGVALGGYFHPGQEPLKRWVDQVVTTAKVSARLQEMLGTIGGQGGATSPDVAAATAVGWFYASPPGTLLIGLNSVAAVVMKALLQMSLAWLLAFYTILGPLAGVTLFLPGTRGIFWGYCRTFLALCLWPALFGIAERVMAAAPYAAAFGSVEAALSSRSLLAVAQAATVGSFSIFVMNVMFFFVFLGVPIAAVKLVNASGAPFRNR